MLREFSKLRGKIIEKYNTLKNFSEAMEWSERTNSLKLNGKVDWSQTEILKAAQLLEISTDEIVEYFFNIKVQ